MMGFVAALSSSIAFIILIMSAQLLNVIAARAQREQQAQSIQISSEIVYHDVNILRQGGGGGHDNDYSYYISERQVKALRDIDKQLKLYCTYGNNFSIDVAKRISAYNYILLKDNQKTLNVKLVNPVLNDKPSQIDSCFLTVDNEKR